MEGLGKNLWNDEEFNTFVTGENTKRYQDYKKRLESDYDKNAANGFFNWLGNGLSGGGWSKKGYLEKRGIDDETDAYGNAGYFGNSEMNALTNAGREYNKKRLSDLEGGKNLFSGVPILGEILSPLAQVTSAGKDFAESGTSKWDSGKRDLVSDIGAGAESALNLVDLIALGGTVSAGKAAAKGGAKALSKNVLKNAGRMAAINAAQGAAGTLREQGSDANLGDIGMSAAIGGGIGAAMGGAAQLGSNAANIARANRAAGAVTTPLARTGLGRVGQGINESLNLGRFTPKRTTAMKVGAGVGGGLLLSKLLGGNKNQNTNAAGMTDEEIYNYIYGGGQ